MQDSIEFQSTSQSKLTALKQLLHTIVLADEAIAPYCERILNVLESTLFTWEEKEFTDVCLSVATALGVAVDSKIYIPLLLKHMQNDVTKASIKSLKIVMVGSCLQDHLHADVEAYQPRNLDRAASSGTGHPQLDGTDIFVKAA